MRDTTYIEWYDDVYCHGDSTFQSHVADDGDHQYIFIQSDAHRNLYGTRVTCSFGVGEMMLLEGEASDFTDTVLQCLNEDYRYDGTWQYLALLIRNEDVDLTTKTLKAKGFKIIQDIKIIWP